MQVNPVSQQAPVSSQNDQPDAKGVASQVAQKVVAKADTVILSERAKDLAAQQAGNGATEEVKESMAAKEVEARYQVTKK